LFNPTNLQKFKRHQQIAVNHGKIYFWPPNEKVTNIFKKSKHTKKQRNPQTNTRLRTRKT